MAQKDRIDHVLARLSSGSATAGELARSLDLSQPSISRSLAPLLQQDRVIRLGSARSARYALRRTIDSIGHSWPLHQIDAQGFARSIGTLHSLAGDQYQFEVDGDATDLRLGGLTDGLPYFLQDQRPGGFLGRAVPQRYPALNLPQRIADWTDDHYLRYLTQHGWDAVGDLILGEHAFDEYLRNARRLDSVDVTARSTRYPQLAQEVMDGGLPGSSAHGEHPKFAAVLQRGAERVHVLVKFSPPTTTAVGQRWSDLLIAEHHAHRILLDADLPACNSRILQARDHTFLEVDRFDRQGAGRIGVTSLWAIDTTLYGQLDTWLAAALRLHRDRRIDAATLAQVRLATTFGELIANTDRHFGNLAFIDRYDGRFSLAPIYDMLPMLFAPQNDMLVAREFVPSDPTTLTLPAWPTARRLAEHFWSVIADDPRISQNFRDIGARCLASLAAFPRVAPYA